MYELGVGEDTLRPDAPVNILGLVHMLHVLIEASILHCTYKEIINTHQGYPGIKTSGNPSTFAPFLPASLINAQTLSTPPWRSFQAGSAWTAAILTSLDGVSGMTGSTRSEYSDWIRIPEELDSLDVDISFQ